MDERLENLRSTKNPKARIKIMKGHFATSNSHLDTYIDMSTVKIRHNNAREAAKVLAQEYVTSTYVDTIVCLDETCVIGAFLAEQLADSTHMALSHKNNISVITPEYNMQGQIIHCFFAPISLGQMLDFQHNCIPSSSLSSVFSFSMISKPKCKQILSAASSGESALLSNRR